MSICHSASGNLYSAGALGTPTPEQNTEHKSQTSALHLSGGETKQEARGDR
jgi:hypothetical protein